MDDSKRTSQAAREARKRVAARDRARTPRERATLALVLGRRIETATVGALGELPIVRLPHLIALKLYAGGFQSKADVQALIERNLDTVNLTEIEEFTAEYGLEDELAEVLAAIDLTGS